jgi:formamidopyrimidine-DNA glycosylase
MPELPDIVVYIEAIRRRIIDLPLNHIRLNSPFLLRTALPPIASAEGKTVTSVSRIGKRIVLGLEDDLYLVLHLMIAGRLHWRGPNAKLAGKFNLAAFDFSNGTLVLTEGGTKRRASLHLFSGIAALKTIDTGGLDVLSCTFENFLSTLKKENHTLKRVLTDPRLFSGIGNSYSDEILFEAQLSPVTLTSRINVEDARRLYTATQRVLTYWTEELRSFYGNDFPEKVTAFRPGMAVHGRFEQPCPRCSSTIQRIRYADNETNYCATCQTGGKLLSDRALSRLLGSDWPKTLDALELMTVRHREIIE